MQGSYWRGGAKKRQMGAQIASSGNFNLDKIMDVSF